MLVKKSQTEKTNAVFSLIYGIYKTKPNITKPKQTHRFAEQVCGYQRGRRWEMRKIGEEKRFPTTSYKITGSQGYNVQGMAQYRAGPRPSAGRFIPYPPLTQLRLLLALSQLMSYWVQPIEGNWREKPEELSSDFSASQGGSGQSYMSPVASPWHLPPWEIPTTRLQSPSHFVLTAYS